MKSLHIVLPCLVCILNFNFFLSFQPGTPSEPFSTNTSEQLKKRSTSLDDISTLSEIDSLTVRDLKKILLVNCVDYKGCFEKKELVDRVKRLWTAQRGEGNYEVAQLLACFNHQLGHLNRLYAQWRTLGQISHIFIVLEQKASKILGGGGIHGIFAKFSKNFPY